MSQKIYLTAAAALGNGTRESGFQIGTCDDDGVLSPAEGVEQVEIDNLARNQHLFTTDPPEVYSGPDSILVPLPGEQNHQKPEGAGGQTSGPDMSPGAAWRSTPVASMPGMEPEHAKLLESHNLLTAGQVFEYGQTHKGLTGLKGVVKAVQQAVTKSLAALLGEPAPEEDDGEDD